MKKRLFCLILSLVMCASLCTPAFAAELPEPMANDAILITVNTQEELDALIAEIEAHNLRAAELWQAALAESCAVPRNNVSNQFQPYATQDYVYAHDTYYGVVGLLTLYSITFWATFTTTTNVYGSTVLDKVRDIGAFGTNDNTQVTINDYYYTIIDQGRTIATNYSTTVGVKASDENSYSYYALDFYVEFYATGGANAYN